MAACLLSEEKKSPDMIFFPGNLVSGLSPTLHQQQDLLLIKKMHLRL